MLLIGSTATDLQLGKWRSWGSKSMDIDLIATDLEMARLVQRHSPCKSIHTATKHRKFAEIHSNPILDVEVAEPGTAAFELLKKHKFAPSVLLPQIGIKANICPVDDLFALKQSHRYSKDSPHFLKTMMDWMDLRKHGAKITDHGWLAQREHETYDFDTPILSKSKSDFFSADGIDYIYDHDSLHEAICYPNKPIYKLYAVEGKDVLSSKAKFQELGEANKLQAVREEAYVLALERSYIPFNGTVNPAISARIALEKVCTSITSGWFREFAWEHYFEVIAGMNMQYVDKFLAGKASGIIKPHTPS